MKKISILCINVLSKFLLDITPYAIIVAMAVGIDNIVDDSNTTYIVIISVIMLIIRFLYHIYEVRKIVEEYKKEAK